MVRGTEYDVVWFERLKDKPEELLEMAKSVLLLFPTNQNCGIQARTVTGIHVVLYFVFQTLTVSKVYLPVSSEHMRAVFEKTWNSRIVDIMNFTIPFIPPEISLLKSVLNKLVTALSAIIAVSSLGQAIATQG